MITIGLLPLYIALYDDSSPELRPRLEAFCERMAVRLESQGFHVLRTTFCRREAEFERAVSGFEQAGAHCLVTLHMAYSPSLESIAVLTRTTLPIVVLDSTEIYDFSPSQEPEEILYCHGIHGVMDMCSLLARNNKPFAIAAGHPERSDVIARAAGFIRAAASAVSLRGSRVGIVGGSFAGMGDFLVSDEDMLKHFGVTVVRSKPDGLRALVAAVGSAEAEEEMSRNRQAFAPLGAVSAESHRRAVRNGLAVRHWVEAEGLAAFTINFSAVCEAGLSTMPFMEACQSMARGIGYAGEGDVLTAAFTGALLRGFPDSSFAEPFCPDWRGNSVFLSHMGEMNIRLAAGVPELAEKSFTFGDGSKTVACYGCFQSGSAVYLNVCRSADGFRLIVSPVTMEAETGRRFAGHIRGWMRPPMPVETFLERLSIAGATHHSVLVYGAAAEQLRFFGTLLGLEVIEIS